MSIAGPAVLVAAKRYHGTARQYQTMTHSPPPTLIVFDWDGTLMDSIGNMVDCTLDAFRRAGLAPPSSGTIRSAIGLGLDEAAARILPRDDPEARMRVLGHYREQWLAVYQHRVALYNGVPEVIETLAKRGHVLAIATGRSRRGLDADLATAALSKVFAFTRTADDAPAKPNPKMLLDVLATLGFAADEALMIGDTSYDMEMAQRAGVAAVGVLTGAHRQGDLETFGPRACLGSVAELPAYLEALSPPTP